MDLKDKIPEQYRVSYDEVTGAFWILDCWHPTIENLNPDTYKDTPIDPKSPAVTIINKEQANALVGELIKRGWLDKIIEGKIRNNEVPAVTVVNTPAVTVAETLPSKGISTIVELMKIGSTDERTLQEAINAVKELALK